MEVYTAVGFYRSRDVSTMKHTKERTSANERCTRMKVVSSYTIIVSEDVLANKERALTKNSWSAFGSCTRHTFRNVGMLYRFMSVALYVVYDKT